ncbi:MAG: pirin family protein [Deltaproteobacteria bacterium]|nr:pirin family protein [Deltaproteobacteria bacterium]
MPNDVRPLAEIVRPMRLPVWPVGSGLLSWASERVGLPGVARALEKRWGGRVTPMQLPVEASDPFLLVVHHRHTFSAWDPIRPLSALVMPEGFPAHPHRGFETVTFVLEGAMRHRDSTGVKMTYEAGSVQWLTAGRGVLHEEMWAHTAGAPHQELYQIWVNLPRARKLDEPQIQLLGPADLAAGADSVSQAPLPVAAVDGVTVTVLAGSCRGVTSPVVTRSPMTLLRLSWAAPGAFAWDELPRAHTALFFVRSGAVEVSGKRVDAGNLACFARGGGGTARLGFTALTADTDVLLLTGAPLGEPVAMGGSMVMNTAAEVERAHRDYREGRFGPGWAHTASDEEWMATVRGTR